MNRRQSRKTRRQVSTWWPDRQEPVLRTVSNVLSWLQCIFYGRDMHVDNDEPTRAVHLLPVWQASRIVHWRDAIPAVLYEAYWVIQSPTLLKHLEAAYASCKHISGALPLWPFQIHLRIQMATGGPSMTMANSMSPGWQRIQLQLHCWSLSVAATSLVLAVQPNSALARQTTSRALMSAAARTAQTRARVMTQRTNNHW